MDTKYIQFIEDMLVMDVKKDEDIQVRIKNIYLRLAEYMDYTEGLFQDFLQKDNSDDNDSDEEDDEEEVDTEDEEEEPKTEEED